MTKTESVHGRGSVSNSTGRFERIEYENEPGDETLHAEEKPCRKTEFYKDATKTIVTKNDSPDIGFTFSINPYRGCEHGCSYCYARPSHEYLGYSAGLDFETKIFVKQDAAELLRKKLMAPGWQPEVIAMSGITDCYQPAERKFKVTRSCLEILAEFRNPVSIITKNALVTRDIDLLQTLASFHASSVCLSMTSLDASLAAKLEPRASRPSARLKAIEDLAKAGIPVSVNVAPVISGLNDHEIPAILKAAADHGARWAGYTLLRLPYSVADIFAGWLTVHFPDRKERVLNRVRSIRNGRLNDPRFGNRMHGEGQFARNISHMFDLYARKYGLNKAPLDLSSKNFQRPGSQLTLPL